MKDVELLDELTRSIEAVLHISRVASKNRKSLRGFDHYGKKFHDAAIGLTQIERSCMRMQTVLSDGLKTQAHAVSAAMKDPAVDHKTREEAARRLMSLIKLELLPAAHQITKPTTPESEPVLASAVLRNSPRYIHRVLLQANGSFLRGWFDASAVMIRRVLESLIIELYERAGREAEIKKEEEYLMLAGLVGKLLNQSHWSLGREVRKGLPQLKTLGDRSAHTRHYLATRQDIESMQGALRVTVDALVHHAKFD